MFASQLLFSCTSDVLIMSFGQIRFTFRI